jgi:hypothetical protein
MLKLFGVVGLLSLAVAAPAQANDRRHGHDRRDHHHQHGRGGRHDGAPRVHVAPRHQAPVVQVRRVWVPGQWSWRNQHRVWIAGYWAVPPHAGWAYVPGTWVRHGHRWVWQEGHWAPAARPVYSVAY